ncbi:aldo/keto reductase [Rheinheimera sp.]|uniref:aldo/keto reductase n=1 Tax=Rheinheimera sp. TaxID=1869214 RepID=UPI00273747B6|nr:aldo/keto reductase [Rheinheimera sp.]MDP2716036.1 aldo/keto reductase [Rheinheimera sp.]
MQHRLTRRHCLKLLAGAMAAGLLPAWPGFAAGGGPLQKTIPGSNKSLPVIGMGTWRTFNVGNDPKLLAARTELVKTFLELGGGLIDSSPMYGSAPDVMGHALAQLDTAKPGAVQSDIADSLFAAEKIWSPAGGSTLGQVADLQRRWNIPQFDLLQVHNLSDWREHLAVLRELKAAGKVGYIGITTSHGRRHREVEQIMAAEDIDFVQLTYNIVEREAEQRLLPLAAEKGIAVIANRPYNGGNLIKSLKRRGERLPGWAAEHGCTSWAEFLLKFIVSHPAISCAIPATTQLAHLQENMRAGLNPMPSANGRKQMARFIEAV